MDAVRHTLMLEDVTMVNARDYGATRDSSTILAALIDLGSTPTLLLLVDEDDGVWTLTSPLTIPPTMTLRLPAGVTLAGTAGLTIQGNVLALRTDWYQSTAPLVWDVAALPSIAALLRAGRLELALGAGQTLTLAPPATFVPWRLTLPTNPGAANHVLITDGAGVTSWGPVVPVEPTLVALAGLSPDVDNYIYFTGPDVPALGLISTLGRTLISQAAPSLIRPILGAAPSSAEYIASTANSELSAERVLVDTVTVTWDRSVAGQIKANSIGSVYQDAPTFLHMGA